MRALLAICSFVISCGIIGCGPAMPPPLNSPPPKPDTKEPIETPDRSKLPGPAEKRDWAPPKVATWTLPNGMNVWHLQQSGAPLISLKMVFKHGAASDPKRKAGLSGLMVDMLDEGAGDKSALQLGEALQRLATDFGAGPSTDGVSLSMSMLSDTLGPSLSLLADIVQRPHLSATEFNRRKKLWLAQALSRQSEPNNARTVVIRRVLYGESYGGWPVHGTEATLKRITINDVKKQYAAIIQPSGASVTVVGDISREAVDAALRKRFGAWVGKPTATDLKPAAGKLPIKAVYRIDFPGASQSSISVARRADGAHAEDFFSAMVYNWALGGSFSSRLNLNLREDKGYTYGARAGFWRWKHAGVYALSAQVKRETTRASVDEMFKELTGLGSNKPLTVVEHSTAIDGLLLGFPGRFERLGSVASQLSSLTLVGRPADWLTQWPERVRSVTLEHALASAKKHAAVDDFAVIVAGDMKVIGDALAKMERPVYDCDAEGDCKKAK